MGIQLDERATRDIDECKKEINQESMMKIAIVIFEISVCLFCLVSQISAHACGAEDVTICNDEASCINAGGYWFDSHWKCIANQGRRKYVDNNDGTISDTVNGLVWQKTHGIQSGWTQSQDYCKNLVLGNQNSSEWRLPAKDELKGLVICTNDTPTPLSEYPSTSINCDGTNSFPYPTSGNYNVPTISPIFQGSASYYWSSTISGQGATQVAGVDFSYGSVGWSFPNSYGYTRCVRNMPDLSVVIRTLQIITGMDLPEAGLETDINSDGKIGIAEAIYALKSISLQ